MNKIVLFFVVFFITQNAYASSLAEVLEWKYGACAGTRQFDEDDTSSNPKMVIWYWKCEAKEPSESEIDALFSEYETAKTDKEQSDAAQLESVLAKLKISEDEARVLVRLK